MDAERGELWSLYVESECSQAEKEALDTILVRLEELRAKPNVPTEGYVARRRAWKRAPTDAIYALSAMFTPWEDPVSDANKVYFTKKGGLRLLMELTDKNNAYAIRKSACSAIWNFGGSEIRLRILLSVGALEFALSLLKEDEEYLQTCGVNIMWGFLEFEDVEQKAVEEGLIENLIPILDKIDNNPTFKDDLVLGAFGNLQACATNPACHKTMIEKGTVELLVKIVPYDSAEFGPLIKYIKTVALGGLMLHVDSKNRLREAKAKEHIQEFLTKFTPQEIATQEKDHGFVWSFMKPFHRLTLSHHIEVQILGAFCLFSLSFKGANREMMIREGLLEKIVCLSWHKDERVRKYGQIALKHFIDNKQHPAHPPSLVEIAIHALRHTLFRKKASEDALALVPTTLAERLKEIRIIATQSVQDASLPLNLKCQTSWAN